MNNQYTMIKCSNNGIKNNISPEIIGNINKKIY